MQKFKFRLSHSLRLILITTAVFYIYVFGFSQTSFVHSLRLIVQDQITKARYTQAQAPQELPLVIAAIDDESLVVLKERWPWPRWLYADFLDALTPLAPRVTAFDLSFAVPDEVHDQQFAESILASENVILGAHLDSRGAWVMPQDELFKSAEGVGYLNFPRDSDNTSRRYLANMQRDGERKQAFALLTAARYQGINPRELDSSEEPEWIAYRYKRGDIPMIPFWHFLKGKVKREQVQDQIVLIGVTGEIFHDIYNTPFGVAPGVVLQANRILNYLENAQLSAVAPEAYLTVYLAVCLALVLIFFRLRALGGLLATAVLFVVSYLIGIQLMHQGLVVDFFSLLTLVPLSFVIAMLYRALVLFFENQRLRQKSERDGLTALYTYRYMEAHLKSAFDQAQRSSTDLSFVIFDIDHFKRLNDSFGHERGNDVLVVFADILKTYSRNKDIVCRYGGEEFCLLLPETGEGQAQQIAERIRESLKAHRFGFVPTGGGAPQTVQVTVSAGICSSKRSAVFNGKELLRLADKALLSAKEKGRDRTILYTSP